MANFQTHLTAPRLKDLVDQDCESCSKHLGIRIGESTARDLERLKERFGQRAVIKWLKGVVKSAVATETLEMAESSNHGQL